MAAGRKFGGTSLATTGGTGYQCGVKHSLLLVLGFLLTQPAWGQPETNVPAGPLRISAAEAERHFQTIRTVTGRVAQVTVRPSLVYLNLDQPHPRAPLTGVIFSADTNRFGNLAELRGKPVELTGRIEDHQGQLQIVLKEASQLKVVEAGPRPRIGARAAREHLRQECVVTGRVAQVTIRPTLVYLNLEEPHPGTPLTGVVFARATNLFGDLSALQGKDVEFTGRIEEHRGQPQIILNATNQLRVVKP